ncbi:hypothetical protein [uncultured Shewanella sp.]|uniref:hypothetical protein n=1 Tax=uncultured Shewanella sp. TaxID=173975 RepID=UPI0026194D37|nr:hypothetical protein [uncultured Shewanella sp.]
MMFGKPIYDGLKQENVTTWEYIHSVWHSWQTLNAAIIAFFASVLSIFALLKIETKKTKDSVLKLQEEQEKQNAMEYAKKRRELNIARIKYLHVLEDVNITIDKWINQLNDTFKIVSKINNDEVTRHVYCYLSSLTNIPSSFLEYMPTIMNLCENDEAEFIQEFIFETKGVFNRLHRMTSRGNEEKRWFGINDYNERYIDIVFLNAMLNRVILFFRTGNLNVERITKKELISSFKQKQGLLGKAELTESYIYDYIAKTDRKEKPSPEYDLDSLTRKMKAQRQKY